ncbi:hypothetical protein HN681_04620 [archaeon]|jgi:Zn-dependent protease|nr:hypothetical protein [archaeon]MBT4540203.1 hypothetical protein [Candidatus Woesearchaeota archaeon]MBT3730991.1 hypothetical protein [archaeon]MBT4669771.1 hypothetical protein [archaeon]MBT5029921.1 hypothetical protein [archaeon]
MFSKKEIFPLIISILVLALALGLDDGTEVFELSYWLSNLVMVTLMVAVSFLIHQLAHKWIAKRQGFIAEYKLWGIKSFRWMPQSIIRRTNHFFPRKINFLGKRYEIKSFPIGVVISLIITLISNGKLFFLALGEYNLLLKRGSRVGKKYVHVTDYEDAKIALAGPMSHIVLLLIAGFFNSYGTLDNFIFINAALAIFYMIPVHKLDGSKIFMGSTLLYVSSLIFIIAVIVLVYFLSIIPLLIIAGLATAIGAVLFYYFSYVKN